MRFEVSDHEVKRAKIPHEIFLTNLIGNHILMAVAAGGIAGSFPWVMALIPVTSVLLLGFILMRAARSVGRDPWYVVCHWQIAARRSRILIAMLGLVVVAAGLAFAGHAYGGMMKEAAIALVIGLGLLPIMVTVLVLVILESDALYHAGQGKLPASVVAHFPNPHARVITEASAH